MILNVCIHNSSVLTLSLIMKSFIIVILYESCYDLITSHYYLAVLVIKNSQIRVQWLFLFMSGYESMFERLFNIHRWLRSVKCIYFCEVYFDFITVSFVYL